MQNKMKKLIKRKMQKFIRWIFAEELRDIKKHITDAEAQVSYQRYKSEQIKRDTDRLMNVLDNIDVSVDVHHYARSWACISIQGKTDYVKFVDLDAAPGESKFIKMTSKQIRGI